MGSIKKISTCYFFNDMIKITNFDSSLLKIDKKSCKNIDIYYTGYITLKNIGDHESIHGVNPLYLIVDTVAGYIAEKNEILNFYVYRQKKKEVLNNTQNSGMGLRI